MTSVSGTSSNGSTIDVASVVSQLMAVEQRPLTLLDNKTASCQTQLSAYGTLKSALSAFQTTMSAITSATKLRTLKTSVSDASVLSATATNTASPGVYALDVTRIAKSQKLVATGQASTSAAIGTGTLTFDFGTIDASGGSFSATTGKYTDATYASAGTTKTVTIDASHNTLAGIRNAINAAAIGVTATIVNDGSGSPYRLVLTSDTTGVANSMKISVTGDAALSNLLSHDVEGTQNLSEVQTAQNALLKVDGLSVSKASNTISDVISGVTLTLTNPSTSTVALAVTRDTSTAQSAAQGFVDTYNSLAKTVKSLTSFDTTNNKLGVLQGDGVAMTLASSMKARLTSAITGAGSYTSLTPVGVGFQRDGTIALDADRFQAALAANPSDLATAFEKYATAFDGLSTTLIQAAGTIAQRTDAINTKMDNISKERDKVTARLATLQKAYTRQFAALDTMLSSMNSTSSYLTQQLKNLPGYTYSTN